MGKISSYQSGGVALLLLGILALFFACNGTAHDGDSQKIFKYNQPSPITSLDPAFAKAQNQIWACHHLFNGLVELDEGLNVRPSIAENWDISEDGLTLTFRLRDDVYFHDHPQFPNGKGRKVVAQDFVYSLRRILDKGVGSPGAWIFDKVDQQNPFSAPDASTFVVKMEQPFLPILGILAMQYCSVVPQEIVEAKGVDFRREPVGTGPFQFKNWLEGQALFLSKNPRYFEVGLPKLDGVKISFVGDRKTAFLNFKKGDLHYLSGLENSFVDELLTKEGQLQGELVSKVELVKQAFLNTEYLGFNMKTLSPPLDDKRVRQALNYGFDRELMLKQQRNSVGQAAESGFTPIGLPGHDARTQGYSYQPEKAKELLAAAGYPNGKGMPEITLTTTPDYLDLCTFITNQWQQLGIPVKLASEDSGTLRNKNKEGQIAFFRGSWIADYPDAENYLVCFKGNMPAPPNYTRFQNGRFDELYQQSQKELDSEKRRDIYAQMEKILIEEAPVVFLFYDERAVFTQKGVTGISRIATNLLDLKRVDIP